MEPPLEPSSTNGHRRPLSEILSRALEQGTPLPTSFEAPPSSPPAAEEPKGRRLAEVFGEVMSYLTEGAIKRAVRYAGREPDEIDDDEIQQIQSGWTEIGQEWLGQASIGPWGRIAVYSTVAGVGMYRSGKPLPPPAAKLAARENEEPAGGGDGD